ncbi:MAG: 30S ribosomal protein S15 [Planctomycetota bacterium]
MITIVKKQELIREHKIHQGDTGSPEIQIALLSERISEITDHLKIHKKDYCSRRGLLVLVGRRSALLKYLVKKDYNRYQTIISKLGLRK